MYDLDPTLCKFVHSQNADLSACNIQISLSACRLIDFLMGLKKLKTLNIILVRDFRGSDRRGDLCKLREHPSLQDIRLISNGGEEVGGLYLKAVDVPLEISLCSFFAMQQLKVLNLLFRTTKGKVKIQHFLQSFFHCSHYLQEAGISQYSAVVNFVGIKEGSLVNLPCNPQHGDGIFK